MPGPPHDPVLDSLPEVLAERGAPPVVCEALRDMGIDADASSGSVIHLRYRPGKNCDVGWRFSGAEGWPGLVSARVFHNDRGARLVAKPAFQQLVARAQEASALSTSPYRYDSRRQLLIQLFPLDSRLPGLVDATSEAWTNATLPALLDGGCASGWRVALRPKAYRAWRRCVLQYERDGEAPQRYFAKLYRDDRGAVLLRRLRSIAAQLGEGPWRVAPPAAYLEEQRMLFLPAIEDGVTLTSLMKSAVGDGAARHHATEASARAAEWLGRFQQVDVRDLPVVTPADVVATLRRKSAAIALVEPELAETFAVRLRALESAIDALPPEPLVPAHGAFRHSQVVVSEGGLVVLDLDTLRRTGANADAGSFLACLDRMAVRREGRAAVARACQEAFASSWRRALHAHEGWLAWHRAAGLVQQALRTYVSLSKRWPQITGSLLRLGEEVTPC
jgi:hypothetical protein